MPETRRNPLLNQNQIKEAVHSLCTVVQKKSTKTKLFSDEVEAVMLQVSVVKIPKDKQVIKFQVPHSIWRDEAEVCLIVKDLQKGLFVDHEPTILHFWKLLGSKGVKKVKQVLSLRQVKFEYKPYESKRNLSNQFDVFLADERIVCYLPPVLGKSFYDRKKLPIQLDMKKKDLKEEVDRALSVVQLPLLNNGPCAAMQVGHTGQKPQEVMENILAVFQEIPRKFPGGWKNVRSIYLKKRSANLSLPIYVSAVSSNDVTPGVGKTKKARWVEDELSTTTASQARVYPDGRVRLVKQKEKKVVVKKPKAKVTGKAVKSLPKKKVMEEAKREDGESESDDEMERAEAAYLKRWAEARGEEMDQEVMVKVNHTEKEEKPPSSDASAGDKKRRKRKATKRTLKPAL